MTEERQQSTTIKVLCIMIIVGNVLIMIKDLLTYSSLEGIADGPIPGYINVLYLLEFLLCLGAIVAAILMLEQKAIGFNLYLIFTILYILVVIVSFLSLLITVFFAVLGIFQLIYLIPPIIFLILFSINWNRST